MAKTLGTLTVLIGASTALFQRELERAGDATEKWARQARTQIGRAVAKIDNDLAKMSKDIDRAFSSPIDTINDFVGSIKLVGPAVKTGSVAIGAFAASFSLAAAAGVKAGQAFFELSEGIQFTADTADRLGVSFEFLQGLENAAQSFGINAGQLNDNLRQMTTNLSSAKLALDAGSSSGGNFGAQVEAMGLTVQEVFDLNPEERFLALTDAIAGLPTETERAAAAVFIFGESGRDLVSITEDGSESLRTMIDQFSVLGAQLSGQELQRIENAREALFQVGLVAEGLKQQFLASFAPIFETLSEFLVQSGLTGAGVADSMDFMADGVARAIGLVDEVIVAGFKTWYGFRSVVFNVASGILDVVAGMQRGVAAAIQGVTSVLASAASRISAFMARVVNSTLDGLNRVVQALNALPNVDIPGIGARVSPHDFGSGLDLGLGANTVQGVADVLAARGAIEAAIAGDQQSTFYEDFLENRNALPVPALPPIGAGGVLPPPPTTGGGGGGRSSGGRSGAGDISQKAAKDASALRDLERTIQQTMASLSQLSSVFSDDLRTTMESNEAEEYRLELMQQGAKNIDAQVSRFESLRDIRNQFIQSETQLEELLSQGLITQHQYSDALASVTEEFEQLEAAFAESDSIAMAQEQAQAVTDITQALNESLREQLGLNEHLTEVERVRAEIGALNVELTEKQVVSLEKLASVVDLTAERTRRLQEQYGLLDETSRVLVDSGSTLFQELIRGTGSLNDKLGNFFNSLFDSLLQLSINTIFQSLLGGSGGGGFLGGLLGFQSGGVVPETGPYILHSGERVFNRAEVGRMRQQDNTVINIKNYSSAKVSTQSNGNGERDIIIRDAVAQARTAVLNDFTRSVSSGYGGYSDGIQGSYKVNRKI